MTGKPRVYITRRVPEAGVAPLRTGCDVRQWDDDEPVPRAVLLGELAEADGVFSLLTERFDAAVFDAAPRLRVVGNMAVGYDNIDVAAATDRGIAVCNTPGVLTETTADLAFALIMATARQLPQAVDYVKAGHWQTWQPMAFRGQDVYGSTLGIVGAGRIGRAVARRASGFAMRVIYHNRTRNPDFEQETGAAWRENLADLLRESDFVSLHTPLTADTHHLIGAHELALMKPTAILVNTARGGVVDHAALYAALQARAIGGAGLDVTDPEPLPHTDPILSLDNVVVLPHIGSGSVRTRDEMARLAGENILAVVEGRPPRFCVNPDYVHFRANM